MRTSDLAKSEPTIPPLLDAMMREVEMNRVGAGGILSRLADVVTATIIRTWVEHGCGDASGWLAAVRNPEVGRVLAAIHLDPAHNWSVNELARHMGASRSGFAQRFVSVVGETPARTWHGCACIRLMNGCATGKELRPSRNGSATIRKRPLAGRSNV